MSGSLSAHLVSSALPNLTANTISVAVNTTSTAVNGLPAGPYLRGELTGATLTVGGQSLSGDFGFQRTVDTTGATVVVAAVNNLTATLGGGVATLSQGIGAVVISGGKLAGFASGTLALNLPGVTLAGALVVQVNQTSGAVNDTFTLGGQPIVINVPSGAAGGYISVAGTGVTLTALGQAISGDVSLTSVGGTTTLTLANGALSLAGGAVTVTGAAGGLTVDAGGIVGNLAATVTTTLTGLAFSSGLHLAIDTRPGTAKLAITGTDTTLTVAGQSLSGDFSAERGTDADRRRGPEDRLQQLRQPGQPAHDRLDRHRGRRLGPADRLPGRRRRLVHGQRRHRHAARDADARRGQLHDGHQHDAGGRHRALHDQRDDDHADPPGRPVRQRLRRRRRPHPDRPRHAARRLHLPAPGQRRLRA